MEMLFIARRAVVFASGFVLLWGWLALNVRAFEQRFGFGIAPMDSKAWDHRHGGWRNSGTDLYRVFVVRGHGTPAIFDAPRVFVATGPYRDVRNPMYLGGWFVLSGSGSTSVPFRFCS